MYTGKDMSSWDRRETFRHFTEDVSSAAWLSGELDVTALLSACRDTGRSFYVSFLFAAASAVNAHEEFRLHILRKPGNAEGKLVVWDSVGVSHNVFHPETETFTNVFTPFSPDYETFYAACSEDIEAAKLRPGMSVPAPPNVFEASCVPWRTFSAAGVISEEYPMYPLVVWGRHRKCGERIMMPVSVQINHAAADGFHLARFLSETEKRADDLARLIKDPGGQE